MVSNLKGKMFVIFVLFFYFLPTVLYAEVNLLFSLFIILVVFMLNFCLENINVSKKTMRDFFILCVITIFIVIFNPTLSYTKVGVFLLPIFGIIIFEDIKINEKNLKTNLATVFYTLVTFFYVYQIYSLKFSETRRTLFSQSQDPNIAACFIFLYFLFLHRLKYKILKYIVLICGVLTFSRVFIMCVILFFILEQKYICNSVMKCVKGMRNIFVKSFLIFTFLLVVYSYYFVCVTDESQTIKMKDATNVDRIINVFNDLSNYHRFSDNVILIETFFNENFFDVLNMTAQEYKNFSKSPNVPHNYFFLLFLNFGLLAFPLVKIIGNRFEKMPESFNYYFVMIIYSQLIATPFLGANLVLLFFICSIKKIKNDKEI